MTAHPTTAVVTVVHGRRPHLDAQKQCLAHEVDHLRVVVAMDDAALVAEGHADAALETTSEGLPLAAARNRGVEVALAAGAEVLVLLDVDVLPAPGCVAAYAEAVASDPGTVFSGPVTYLPPPPPDGYDLARVHELDEPHPARPAPAPGRRESMQDPDLFWSLSFACSDTVWREVGGFCEEYRGYGGEDTDFARLVLRAGGKMAWEGSARAHHQWHPVQRPPLQHLDSILRNSQLFARRWGEPAMRGWLTEFEQMGLVVPTEDGGWTRRRQGGADRDHLGPDADRP